MSRDTGVSPAPDSPESGSRKRRNRLDEGFGEPQQHWRMALASIGDAVIATDSAGVVTFLNPVAGFETTTFVAVSGYDSDQIPPIFDGHFVKPVDHDALNEFLSRLASKQRIRIPGPGLA